MTGSAIGRGRSKSQTGSGADAFHLVIASDRDSADQAASRLPEVSEVHRWTLDPAWCLLQRPEALEARRRLLVVNRLCFRSSRPGTARPFALDSDSTVEPSRVFSGLDHFLRILRRKAEGASPAERAWMRALAGHTLEQFSRIRTPYQLLDHEFERHPDEPPAGPLRVAFLRQRREWLELYWFVHERAAEPGPWALVVECPSEWGERQIRILAHEILRHMTSMKRSEEWKPGYLGIEAPVAFSMTPRAMPNPTTTRQRAIDALQPIAGDSPIHHGRWRAYRQRFAEELAHRAESHGTTPEQELRAQIGTAWIEIADYFPWVCFGNKHWRFDPYEAARHLKKPLGELTAVGLLGRDYRKGESRELASQQVELDDAEHEKVSSVFRENPLEALDALIAAEESERELKELLQAATPKQAEVVRLLLGFFRRGIDSPEAKHRTAEALGVTVNSVDKHLSRLRNRAS